MGIIASTYETSRFANNQRTFWENLPGPFLLGPANQPHALPPFTPLMDRVQGILADLRADGEAAYADAGFAGRTQLGMPAWAGPPGFQETRPIRVRPEASDGTMVNTSI